MDIRKDSPCFNCSARYLASKDGKYHCVLMSVLNPENVLYCELHVEPVEDMDSYLRQVLGKGYERDDDSPKILKKGD